MSELKIHDEHHRQRIKKVQNFDELYLVLEKIDIVHGSGSSYFSSEVIDRIKAFRKTGTTDLFRQITNGIELG